MVSPLTDVRERHKKLTSIDFYHCDFYARHYRKAGAYMSILAHANPQLRICEVGSGTGSATSKVLPFLVDSEGLQADQMVRYVDSPIFHLFSFSKYVKFQGRQLTTS